jgi:hypothetical protein
VGAETMGYLKAEIAGLLVKPGFFIDLNVSSKTMVSGRFLALNGDNLFRLSGAYTSIWDL